MSEFCIAFLHINRLQERIHSVKRPNKLANNEQAIPFSGLALTQNKRRTPNEQPITLTEHQMRVWLFFGRTQAARGR